MNPTTDGSFPEVSNDLGSADDQPIERTYKIVPYDSTSWFNDIPMHSHVFMCPTNTVASSDPMHHMHHPQSGEYFALTPAQLNWVLHNESKKAEAKGEVFYPHDAARKWKYVGVNMTPAEDKNDKKHTKQRFITVHIRGTMMDNHWEDAAGGDKLSFVFKFVRTKPNMSYVVGLNDVRAASNEYTPKSNSGSIATMEYCVQVVAMRGMGATSNTEALARVPGDPELDKDLSAMGVHVPVGIMRYNPYTATHVRDDELWTKVGVICADSVKAASEHVQALVFAI